MIDAPPPSPFAAQGDPTRLILGTIKGDVLSTLGVLFRILPNVSTIETLSASLDEDVTVTFDYFETAKFTFSKDEGLISNGLSSTP